MTDEDFRRYRLTGILPVWVKIRAILFQPCLTAERGAPWEDTA